MDINDVIIVVRMRYCDLIVSVVLMNVRMVSVIRVIEL